MADKLTGIRIKQGNSYSDQIPIWTKAQHVTYDNNYTIQQALGKNLNINENGSVKQQLNSLSSDLEALRLKMGTPLIAETAADMIDSTKIYVYTGSGTGDDVGYTTGHWYYYNDNNNPATWDDGGAYQSSGINTDTTLSVSGVPADAAAVGQMIQVTNTSQEPESNTKIYINTQGESYNIALQEDLNEIENEIKNNITQEFDENNTYSIGDYVFYENKIYKCIKDINYPTNWQENNWIEIDIANELVDLNKEDQNQITYTETSGGDFITFENGIANKPISQIIIDIQPTKPDLHGYDSLWAPGGNVNLIPDGIDTNNGYVANAYLDTEQSASNYVYSYSSGGYYISEYFPITAGQTYTWSVTGTIPNNPSICFYQYIEGEGYQYLSGYKPNGVLPYTFTAPENATHARSSQRSALFQLQLGATATTIVPYRNMYSITGINKIQIANTGRNLAARTRLTENVDYTQYYPCLLSPGYYHLSFTKSKNNNTAVRMKRCSKFSNITTSRSQSGTTIYRVTGTADTGNNQYASGTSFSFWLSQYTNIIEFYAGAISGQNFNNVNVQRYEDWQKFSQSSEQAVFSDGGYHIFNFNFSNQTFNYSEIENPITVYGGQWNSTGKLISTWGHIDNYDPTNDNSLISGKWISDRDNYAPNTYPSEGAQVIYELEPANYITYTFEPQKILMVDGINYLRTSYGTFNKVKTQKLLNSYLNQQLSDNYDLIEIKDLNFANMSLLQIPWSTLGLNIGESFSLTASSSGKTYEKIIPVIKNEKYEIKLTFGDSVQYYGPRAFAVTDENNIIQQKELYAPLLNSIKTISFMAKCTGWLNITVDLSCQNISIYKLTKILVNNLEEKVKNLAPVTYKTVESKCNKNSFTANKSSTTELKNTFSFSDGLPNYNVKSLIFKLDPRQAVNGTFSGWNGLSIKIGHGNLFDRTKALISYILDRNTGEPVTTNSKILTTQFINIHNANNLFIQYYHHTNQSEYGSWRIAFYNKDKEPLRIICSETPRPDWATAASNVSCYKELPLLLRRDDSNNIMIPANAEYVRVSFSYYYYAIIMTDISEYNYTFSETVYGGQLDLLNGKLIINKNFINDYNPETSEIDFSTGGWISSTSTYNENEGNSPLTGSQVVYDCEPRILNVNSYPVVIKNAQTLIIANQKHSSGAFSATNYPYFNWQADIKIEYAASISTDISLSNSGIPADAKIVGDNFNIINNSLDVLNESAGPILYTSPDELIVIDNAMTTTPIQSFKITLPVVQSEYENYDEGEGQEEVSENQETEISENQEGQPLENSEEENSQEGEIGDATEIKILKRPLLLYDQSSIKVKHYGTNISDNYQEWILNIPENLNFIGGTLNFITGQLTTTYKYFLINDLTTSNIAIVSFPSASAQKYKLIKIKAASGTVIPNNPASYGGYSEYYPTVSKLTLTKTDQTISLGSTYFGTTRYIYIRDDRCFENGTSALAVLNKLKTIAGNCAIAYKINSTTIHTFNSHEIYSLEGTNTFSSESYENSENYIPTIYKSSISYYASLKNYVEKNNINIENLISNLETTNKASRTYYQGEFFIKNNSLYQIIVNAVSKGKQLIENTNYIKINLNDILLKPKSKDSVLLGYKMPNDAKIKYQVGTSFVNGIKETINNWMSYYGGDERKVPFILHTDQHGRLDSSRKKYFDLISYLVNWNNVSACFSLGDTIYDGWGYDNKNRKNVNIQDTNPLLKNKQLENMINALSSIPLEKQINIFGNHDTWCDYNVITDSEYLNNLYPYNNNEKSFVKKTLPSLQYLTPYFKTNGLRTIKNSDNSGLAVIYDDYYKIKYLIITDWDYIDYPNIHTISDAPYNRFFINSDHLRWIINEMSKNEGYDLVLVSHVPLARYKNNSIYTYSRNPVDSNKNSDIRIVYGNSAVDSIWNARRNKTSGSITYPNSNGETITYDFTACTDNCLCAISGHTHANHACYIQDTQNNNSGNNESGLLQVTFSKFMIYNNLNFGIFDRTNQKIKIFNIYYDYDTDKIWKTRNYELPFDQAQFLLEQSQ